MSLPRLIANPFSPPLSSQPTHLSPPSPSTPPLPKSPEGLRGAPATSHRISQTLTLLSPPTERQQTAPTFIQGISFRTPNPPQSLNDQYPIPPQEARGSSALALTYSAPFYLQIYPYFPPQNTDCSACSNRVSHFSG